MKKTLAVRSGASATLAAAIVSIATGCASIATVTVNSEARSTEPTRVAVLNFAWDPTRGGPDEVAANRPGTLLADCVSSRLKEIPGLTIVPRETVKRVTAEHLRPGPTLAELVRQGKFAEVATMLDANALVLGDVENDDAWVGWVRSNQNIAFTCRCVDARTGHTLWTMAGQKVTGPYGKVNPNATMQLILNDAIPKLRQGLGS